MTDETLPFFLDKRQRTLENQLAALAGELKKLQQEIEAKQTELGQIQAIQGSLAGSRHVLAHSGSGIESWEALAQRASARMTRAPTTTTLQRIPRFSEWTIKECVIQALLDNYPDGATATEIRDFIRDAYGRTIPPSSLRPQMHRLKSDEVLGLEPSTDMWNFRDGKRRLYAMYSHPASRAEMKELHDDEPSEDHPSEPQSTEEKLAGIKRRLREQRARESLADHSKGIPSDEVRDNDGAGPPVKE